MLHRMIPQRVLALGLMVGTIVVDLMVNPLSWFESGVGRY